LSSVDTQILIALIDRMADRRAVVVGDVVLDEYLYGRADRLSREAPIPVLEFTERRLIPGGAANPAANIASLGSHPVQIGAIGADEPGAQLRSALIDRGVDPAGLVVDPTRPTTTKTRLMAQMGLHFPQQVARIDRVDRRAIASTTEQAVIDQIRVQAIKAEALIASDYLGGLLTATVVAALREIGHAQHRWLTADAQGEFSKYRGFDLIKCNADEAAAYVGHPLRSDDEFATVGARIATDLDLRGGMLITRGSDGMTWIETAGTATHLAASHVEDVFDTVGAGDTALAVITLALVAGATYPVAAALANFASGFVIRKVGNYALTPIDLRWAIETWNK